ncbi:ImmA/IrrE family metallo-endopeptidase [Rhizobium sp. A37_96]
MTAQDLKFRLTWCQENGIDLLTTAKMAVLIDGDVIWPIKGENIELEIQADDLLSHLTEFWKPLLLRQTYPLGLRPPKPSLLRADAERFWEGQSDTVAERYDECILAFEEAHDLSHCFAGQFGLPSLWLLREGDIVIIDTGTFVFRVDFTTVRRALDEVGKEITARLSGARSGKWDALLDAWNRRNDGDPASLLAWSASLDRALAREFVDEGLLFAPRTVDDASNDNDELRLAARMASALPSEDIRNILRLVREFRKGASEKLDQLSNAVASHIAHSFSNQRPHVQGEAAATFVRDWFHLDAKSVVDVFELVKRLDVDVYDRAVDPDALWALAVWGNRHGPAVLLNEKALRGFKGNLPGNRAARVNLAHELCHLLLDRGHALGAVDVLNSRMPGDVERRAKAFAGEFLLPSRSAGETWVEARRPRSTDEVKKVVQSLAKQYKVTFSVAAWKLEHGVHELDEDISVLLNAVAPNR